jgi:dimethylargininase
MVEERYTRAVVRAPSDAYAGCLRRANISINASRARVQHAAYVAALRQAGARVVELTPLDLPDAVFVEDTAVALGDRIVLTRPGAMTRRQEVMTVADFFEDEGLDVTWLGAGTLDGGDVMRVAGHVLIGLSGRTDADGAKALAEIVTAAGMIPVEVVVADRIHLKSTCSTLDATTIIASERTVLPELPGVRVLRTPPGEELASNCVGFGGTILVPAGNPRTEELLAQHGYAPVALDLGEIEKGDGGATCLSVRY